jgi:outer membrane protein assembly factor BamB
MANKGLSLYAVGETRPLGSAVAFTDTPKGAAWIDDKVLVWGPTRAVCLAGQNGAMLWEVTLKSFGAIDIASPGEVAVDTTPQNIGDAEQAMIERRLINQRLRAQRGVFVGNVVGVNGMAVQGQPQVVQPNAGEQFDLVRPTGDRAVFSTSTGRLVGLDLSNGKAAWQTRLVDGPLLQLLASDDFTVARFADASGVQIAALDTFTGQTVGPRRVFTLDGSRQPINMALSPDGTLVYTLTSQMCGKNLFEPGKELNFQMPDPPDGQPRFAGANLPDQLIVASGRILAVCDNGMYVRAYSLENGKELNDGKPLQTGVANNWAVFLRPVGSRLYIVNPRSVASYNLDRVEDTWGIPRIDVQPPPAVRDAMVGQDYIVLLDQISGQNANGPGPRQGYRLLAHRRTLAQQAGGGTIESGLLDYDPVITSPAGISTEWQGVNGGFYYRTLDRAVHFLRGARAASAG